MPDIHGPAAAILAALAPAACLVPLIVMRRAGAPMTRRHLLLAGSGYACAVTAVSVTASVTAGLGGHRVHPAMSWLPLLGVLVLLITAVAPCPDRAERPTRLRTAITGALVVLLLIPAGLASAEMLTRAVYRSRTVFLSQVVDVGGHHLDVTVHRQASTTDAPVIVFENGSGETQEEWDRVIPLLAHDATIVTYDRAGYARSEPSPAPRTGQAVITDLRRALTALGADRQVVLVAHSIGGLYARSFAHTYPDVVSGLVLVDARPEDDARRTAPLLAASSFRAQPGPAELAAYAQFGVIRLAAPVLLDGAVPAEQRAHFLAVTATPQYFAARQDEAARIGTTEEALRGQHLGDLPVVVIERGIPQDYARAGIDSATGRQLEAIWHDGQVRMLGISRSTSHVVADRAGHLIPAEQPSVIATAIAEVLDRIGTA